MRTRYVTIIIIILILLVSCNAPPDNPTPARVMPTPRPPVTLAPTYTPPSTQAPLPTITPPPPRETAVPDTPIPFDETVVELRYQIPALGLDRRLQGNVANQIIVVDEATGRSIQRNNEGSIMFELRQALSSMELESMPADCPGCVFVEYELSDAGITGSGWLKDPVLLASIENFMTATLGPHFPQGAVIGLRRSASPYEPGHSIAVAEDGRLWMWLASEDNVSGPIASEAAVSLLAARNQISLDNLNDLYQADCIGAPIETLQLTQGENSWAGQIICPELTLPTTLQPLYVQLDSLVTEKTANASLPKPDSVFPIDALIQYTRTDDTRLTLFPNSVLIASDSLGSTYTTTLTSTLPISLTTGLLDTGLLQPGFETFIIRESEDITTTVTAEPLTSKLAVRGTDGVVDAEWSTLPNFDAIRFLDALLDSILPSDANIVESGEETPEAGLVEEQETPTAEP